jgi:hypothetical protein
VIDPSRIPAATEGPKHFVGEGVGIEPALPGVGRDLRIRAETVRAGERPTASSRKSVIILVARIKGECEGQSRGMQVLPLLCQAPGGDKSAAARLLGA